MIKFPLSQFVEQRGQSEAARLLGLTQAGIRKALLAKRSIVVIDHQDGTFSAEEVKAFPSTKADDQNTAA